MGFEIHNQTVLINDCHNQFSNTTADHLPKKVVTKNGLVIHSLFSRLSGPARKRTKDHKSDSGDNSPLIYALKGKDGLKTTLSTIKQFQKSSAKRLTLFAKNQPRYDVIIPIPSGHKLCLILAKRVSREYEGIRVIPNLLRKRTLQESLEHINNLQTSTTPAKTINRIRNQLKKQIKHSSIDSHLAIKAILTRDRKHLSPVKLNPSYIPRCAGPERILLIDDQVSSASTLMAAKDTLQEYYPNAQIDALALFGPLHGKLR